MKIGIGTVQFGLDYGISNTGGRTPEDEVRAILESAERHGTTVIDTAAGYGDSEEVLGETLPAGHHFRIVTKTPAFDTGPITPADADRLRAAFHESLRKLKARSVYGLMIHHADDLLAENGHLLMEALVRLKEEGFVSKVGASAYTEAQVDGLIGRFAVDIVQVPLNVLDQRLLRRGVLGRLKAAGVEVHVRSAFLQGLLLMPPEELPPFFAPVRAHLAAYRAALEAEGMTPVAGALGFLLGLDEVDAIICGVNDRAQLEEIYGVRSTVAREFYDRFALGDDHEAVLDPSRWPVRTGVPDTRAESA